MAARSRFTNGMEALLNCLLAIRLAVWQRYAVATALIALMTGVHLLLRDTLRESPYLLYYPVIILCGLSLDRATSIYATFASAFLTVFLFVEPTYTLRLADTRDTVALLLFLVIALTMSTVIEALRLSAERLKVSRDDTAQALTERDLLFAELSHRVKNDLQAVSFLLRIQSMTTPYPEAKLALEEAADRVSIMARLHTRLAQRDPGQTLCLSDFFNDLIEDFRASRIGSLLVTIELHATPISVGHKQAGYLGLILNELLTNALKYAFPDNRIGRIDIAVDLDADGQLSLQVADNGVGYSADAVGGQGSKLVRSLVQVLNGSFVVSGTQGTTCLVRIPIDGQAGGAG